MNLNVDHDQLRDSGLRTATILIIDDEPQMTRWVEETLEQEGFLTFSATSSEDALSLLKVLRVDVIVSDVMMPGLNGLDVLGRVKEGDHDIEIVLMTGYRARSIVFEAWTKGACGFLEKPFTAEQIVGAVHCALARAHLRRENWPWRSADLERPQDT